MNTKLFTSESVTEGHPDKICDRISDAVLDSILAEDADARVACETAVTTGMIFVLGEITTRAYVDIPKIARDTVKEIGYDNINCGFDGGTCAVLTSIDEQSPDIARGVQNDSLDMGAGDQGMVFGYACSETSELMPLPISLAHKLAKSLDSARKDKILDFLRPDGKTQVTVLYENGRPVKIDTVVVSAQHSEDVDMKTLRDAVTEEIIFKTIPSSLIDKETKIFINPTGRFVIGGPQGDSGLTGRKIIVDTYGGYSRHGGGAFSGKDPTKVDRSAAYAARYVAKNIVAAGMAERCEIEIAYAIGVAKPVSVMVTAETFGTARVPEEQILKIIYEYFDLRPSALIKELDLRRPIYKNLAVYGHMGREDLGVKWESTEISKDFVLNK